MHKDDSLIKAARITCPQRNQLRNVKGLSPVQLVLGAVPRLPGAPADEDVRLTELKTDKKSEFVQDLERLTSAGTAFPQANTARAVREALLARTRPLRRRYEVGEWCYYWREGESALEKCCWRGPALVTIVEPSAIDSEKNWDSTVWMVHGSSLQQCTHEQLRPETPEERNQREQESDFGGFTTPVPS